MNDGWIPVEECRKAKRFKEYFDELYGIGLEVANLEGETAKSKREEKEG